MEQPSSEQIKNWIDAYLRGRITASDRAALESWYNSMPDTAIEWEEEGIDSAEALKREMLAQLQSKIRQQGNQKNIYIRRYWVAAAAFICILFGLWIWKYSHKQERHPGIAVVHDLPPGTTKAVLILSNGEQLTIDTVAHGQLAVDGKSAIINNHGIISYKGNASDKDRINTLRTSRGQQSPPLTLSDGTRVWLNAASTLEFPVAFSKKERIVQITGEAYFEVAKNPERPFIVKTRHTIIKVLGTHFDVKDYSDDNYSKTTLLEGSIMMHAGKNQVLLHPGQEAKTNSRSGNIQVQQANGEDAIAWLQGQLPIRYMGFEELMRQLGRWYDIDVQYAKDNIPKLSFSGSLSRQVNLSTILAALSANGIKCHLEGRTVFIDNAGD